MTIECGKPTIINFAINGEEVKPKREAKILIAGMAATLSGSIEPCQAYI